MIVDGHALIYRAYHAFPPLTDSSGRLVNAVYGFSRILLTAISDFRPEYIAVAFDHKAPTKRAEVFADYKAHRPKMPDDLIPQIEIIKDVVDALNIPRYEQAGYEADDLIGTVSARLATEVNPTPTGELLTTIVTGDKDLLQLVDKDTHVFIPSRGKYGGDVEYNEIAVKEKLGVQPNQVVELKALMGDTSDNIPGVLGVGQKTAEKLVSTFGSLEKLYEAVEKGTHQELLKGKLLERLQKDRENAFLSRELATILRDIPVEFDLEHCRVSSYDKTKAVELFQQYDFSSLINLLPVDKFEQGVQDALF